MKIKVKIYQILKKLRSWACLKTSKTHTVLNKCRSSIKKYRTKIRAYLSAFLKATKNRWNKSIGRLVHFIMITFFKLYWEKISYKSKLILKIVTVAFVYVVTVLLLAYILDQYDLLNLDSFTFDEDSVDFASVLLTLVGMLGTIMAIVFSLSVLAVQKSSDSYSSRYIRYFIWDWREYSIYSTFTLSILGLLYLTFRPDLYNAHTLYFGYLALVILTFLLLLIFIQYKTVTKKIDPYYAITVLAKECYQHIQRTQSYSQQLSAINSFSKDHSIAMKAVMFQYNFLPLQSRIKDIYSISMRLSDKGDIETVNFGFEAIKRILLAYFNAMKDSTFVYLSDRGLLAFDAQGNTFLSHLYEKLEAAGVKFIEIRAWDNARTIVDTYYGLCLATVAIKPALSTSPALNGENPTFNLTRGYFAKFIEVAMAKKDLETVFKAVQVIEPIMKVVINNNLQIQSSLLMGIVRKILIYDIVNNTNLLTEYCVDIYTKSLRHITFSENGLGYYFLLQFFNELKEVFQVLPNDAQIKWLISIQSIVLEINPQEHGNYADNIIAFFGQLHEFFRDQFISQKITSNFWLLAQLLEYIVLVIQKLERHRNFAQYASSLNDLSRDFIQLPVTFFGFIKGEAISDGKLATKLVNVAYKPMQEHFKDNSELLKSCAESVVKILNYLTNKDKYDAYYELPRIALKLVYLGTLAKQLGFNEIVDYIVLQLYEFEYKYVEKYFAHLPDDQRQALNHEQERLSLEISQWRDVVGGWRQNDRVFYEDDGMTYGINLENVDNFIFYAWSYFFADSHIEETLTRKQLLKRFISVLKHRSQLLVNKK